MGNAVVHFEIGAADDGPLAAFYRNLFGWQLQPMPGGEYTMVGTGGDGGINGGIGRSRTGEPWLAFYVETEDLQATLDKAESFGGATITPVTDIGENLTVAMLRDPDGLPVGLVRQQPVTSAETEASEPGPPAAPSPVTWFEVFGSDPARTQQFYADLFGWTVTDTGIPGYAVVDTGDGRGIQGGLGGGLAARWATVYARVSDVDQTLSRVEELGGSRVLAPEVSALKSAARAALYGSVDQLKTSEFRDPAGNVFGIFHYGDH